MNRRSFIKSISAGILFSSKPFVSFAGIKTLASNTEGPVDDSYIKDYLSKIENFDLNHESDLFLGQKKQLLLGSSLKRFKRIQRIVGHGRFSLISIDQAIHIAKSYTSIGSFTRAELDFLEMLFYKDGALYGFLGSKPLENFTDRLNTKRVVKIPGTGHYLYKGRSLETYKKIKNKIGEEIVLTSGLRSVTKQFLLFLNKAEKSGGNLSLASRSLAPPGYSLHGLGDFDIGQKGYGAANFTRRFTETTVYKKIVDSGYAHFRYSKNNALGVRFEPWHIKVYS